MALSQRAYARHRGVSHVSVKKAIDAGRIILGVDGTIDPAVADRQWEANTVQPKHCMKHATAAPKAATKATIGVAAPAATDQPGKGMNLLTARTANEIVRAQTGKVRLAKLKGELIDRNQAIAQVFKLARTERDAWVNWPTRVSAEMAATLGVDPHTMHIALESVVREHLLELGTLQPRFE